MRRALFAASVAAVLQAVPVAAQESIVGTYRLLSFVLEVDGLPPVESMGKKPRGLTVFTPTHVVSVTTAEQRKFGTTVEDRAALWDTIIAYGGRYRIEADRITVAIDASWNESWNGTEVRRVFRRDGNRLFISTVKAPYSRDPSKMAQATVVLEKLE